MSRAQVSFEFVLIFTLVLIALSGFTYLINERVTEIRIEQQKLVMKNLGNNIVNEILIANSVNNNYLRRFDMPIKISGSDYSINIVNGNDIVINLIQENKIIDTDYISLPIKIKGNFMQNITDNTTDHCITKSDVDGIRISRNQASIDLNKTIVNEEGEFDVFISLNCVNNAKSIQFTIKYDAEKLEIIDTQPIVRSNVEYRNLNPLFNSYSSLLDYTHADEKYIDNFNGRFTYGYIGRGCATGSGNIAKVKFKVKELVDPGDTIIEFDQEFESEFDEENLRLLDCTTNKFTTDDLPDTKNNAKITII
jgi:hypothetical protein